MSASSGRLRHAGTVAEAPAVCRGARARRARAACAQPRTQRGARRCSSDAGAAPPLASSSRAIWLLSQSLGRAAGARPGLRAAPPPGAPAARRGAGDAPGVCAGAGCGDDGAGGAAFGVLGGALDGPAAGAGAGRASRRARRRRARDTAPVTFSSEYTSAHRPTRCATTSGGTKMSGCTIAGPAGARCPWDQGKRPQPSMSADAWVSRAAAGGLTFRGDPGWRLSVPQVCGHCDKVAAVRGRCSQCAVRGRNLGAVAILGTLIM